MKGVSVLGLNFFLQFVKVGALKPAEAEAPATPSKDDSKDLLQWKDSPAALTSYTRQYPHIPSEEK